MDGTTGRYDLVVLATGYQAIYPFIDPEHLNWVGTASSLPGGCAFGPSATGRSRRGSSATGPCSTTRESRPSSAHAKGAFMAWMGSRELPADLQPATIEEKRSRALVQ